MTADHANKSGCAGAIVKSEWSAKGTPFSTSQASGHILWARSGPKPTLNQIVELGQYQGSNNLGDDEKMS